jgi:hypothetical protein
MRGDQQVARRAQPVLERLQPCQLHDFGAHPAPGRRLPFNNTFRRESDAIMSLDHATSTLAAFPNPAARPAAGSVVESYIGRWSTLLTVFCRIAAMQKTAEAP